MSAYAHQMERQFSGLSSRGNSESGSRYSMESGFYMTSFAATIFMASLVTFGVLMVTLLIALTTMLQTCEIKSSGVVEVHRLAETFSYCSVLSLHSEINRFEALELPLFCRDVVLRRIQQGVYLKELNFTIQIAITYFQSIKPLEDDKSDAVVIDVDEILAFKEQESSHLISEQDSYYIEEAKHQKCKLTLELYSNLRSQGYSMVLLSRKPEKERNETVEQLTARGYSNWSGLIMREEHAKEDDTCSYFTRQKKELEEEYRIKGVIGNHMDVLTGQWHRSGKRLFKLPSPTFNGILDSSERLHHGV